MKQVLFIACHKQCDIPQDSLYLPLQVGAYGKEEIGFQRDDEGISISEKNPLYSELTGLYWCWKNLEYDYLGLVHYRRYFTLKSKSYQKQHGPLRSVLTKDECDKLTNQYKVIVPKKRHYYIETIYNHYSHTFSKEHLDVTRTILLEKYPDYVSSWDLFMKQTSAYVFNMFMMKKELVEEYCEWLFDILAELDNRIDSTTMTDFEKRYIGRISERLFNVWLMNQIKENKIKEIDIKEIPYFYIGDVNWPKKIYSFLMAKLFHKKYKESF